MASRSSPRTTRSSTSSGRRGRTAGPMPGAARSTRGCGSRARPASRSAGAAASDFILGLAVSWTAAPSRALPIDELAEIVAWHDERRLMDYVTCGTGSYFDFYPIIPVSLYRAASSACRSRRLEAVVKHAVVQAESHIRTPAAPRPCWPRCTRTWSASCAARSPTPPRPKAREDAPRMSGRASRATSCAGAAGHAITGSRASGTRRRVASGGAGDNRSERRRPARAGRWAGPAGLEAAAFAASAVTGHVLERGPQLGGQFRLAGRQPSRGQITDLLTGSEHRLRRSAWMSARHGSRR
jgi:hypothetical protein